MDTTGTTSAAIRKLVNEQAEDGGLWFVAQYASEAYLQQALRRLHAAVEGDNANRGTVQDAFQNQAISETKAGDVSKVETVQDEPKMADYIDNEWEEGDGLPGPAYRRKYGIEPHASPAEGGAVQDEARKYAVGPEYLSNRIKEFESKYGRSSDEFITNYDACKSTNLDFDEWASLLEFQRLAVQDEGEGSPANHPRLVERHLVKRMFDECGSVKAQDFINRVNAGEHDVPSPWLSPPARQPEPPKFVGWDDGGLHNHALTPPPVARQPESQHCDCRRKCTCNAFPSPHCHYCKEGM